MTPIIRTRQAAGSDYNALFRNRRRAMAHPDEGNVELQHLGETFTATWKVQRGVLSVSHTGQDGVVSEIEAPLGSVRPTALARLLLSEIVASLIVQRAKKGR